MTDGIIKTNCLSRVIVCMDTFVIDIKVNMFKALNLSFFLIGHARRLLTIVLSCGIHL